MINIEIKGREIVILSTVMYIWDEGAFFERLSDEEYANLYTIMEQARDVAVETDPESMEFVYNFKISFVTLRLLIEMIMLAHTEYDHINYRLLADNLQTRLNHFARNN